MTCEDSREPFVLEPGLLARDLRLARRIQDSFLPRDFPAKNGFGLAGFCRSARLVGGDFYDVVLVDEQGLLLFIADVMGKGVAAAPFAATLRTLFRTLTQSMSAPAELLGRINQALFPVLSGADMFITTAVALVDTRARTLRVASAGHCPVLLGAPGRPVRPIASQGLPLGIVPDASYAQETAVLQPGAGVLLYTDGLTERRSRYGDFFGQTRLQSWLEHSIGSGASAAQLKESLLAEFYTFNGGAPSVDDETFLLLLDEKFCVLSLPSAVPESSEGLAVA